jgi:hypothetical protein
MLSRFFLILAGLFAGMWLRDASGTLFNLGFPALSLVSPLFAVAAAPTTIDRDARGRLEEAGRQWLDTWHRLRSAPDKDRVAAEQELTSAAHMIALTANDRVVKSLQSAMQQDLSPAAVAQLVLDMRRSLRRASVTLRPADLEALLAPNHRGRNNGRSATPENASPASFLS